MSRYRAAAPALLLDSRRLNPCYNAQRRVCTKQKERAMTKAALIAELNQEQGQWEELLAAIALRASSTNGEARMGQPGVAGPWSIKDIVAHLTGWRRRTVGRLQAALRAEPDPEPPWRFCHQPRLQAIAQRSLCPERGYKPVGLSAECSVRLAHSRDQDRPSPSVTLTKRRSNHNPALSG
jgi:hypothetical protein